MAEDEPGKEISIEIKNPLTWVLLGILLVVLCMELMVTLSSPIAFGDEGYYVHLGRWIAANKEFPVWTPLYSSKLTDWGNFKPPLLVLIESGLFSVFGFSEILAKFLFPFIGFLTALGVFLLGKRMFSEKAAFFAAILTVTVSSFITYSVIFYAEILSAFVFALGALFILMHITTKEKKYLILSGIFLGLGLLTKIPNYALLFFIPLVVLYEVIESRKVTKDTIKRYGVMLLLAVVIGLPFFIRDYVLYGVPSCEITFGMPSNCSRSFNYTPANTMQGASSNVGTSASIIQFGILQYLSFSIGTVWFIPLIFVCGLAFMLAKREKILILLILILIIIIPVVYQTLDSRVEETSRYTIVAVPIIALVCGIYLERFTDFLKKFHNLLSPIAIAIIILIAFSNFGIPFLNFPLWGVEASNQVLGSPSKLYSLVPVKAFDSTFFTTCDWIKKNLPQNVTILSFNTHPTVYNCERDALWNTPDLYDILSGNLTVSLSRLKAEGYTHVFVQMFSVAPGNQDGTYPLPFVQMMDQNPNYFKSLYTDPNGDTVSSCVQKLNSGKACDGGIVYEINYSGAS